MAAELAPWVSDLKKRRLEEVELFVKQGRSRRFERGVEGESSSVTTESGWAVWGGTSRADTFYAPDNFGLHFHPGGADSFQDDGFRASLEGQDVRIVF